MGTRISLKRTSTENTAYVVQPTRTAKIMLSDQCGDRPDKYQQAGELLYKHGWRITGGSPPVGLGATYTKRVRFPNGRDVEFKCLAKLAIDHVVFYHEYFGIQFPLALYDKLERLLESWAKDDVHFKVTTEPAKKPYRVVDFQDRPLGEGTLTEVQEIFRERYPHFENKDIQPFIYEQ